ncbi:MAG: flagellar basal-body rod protein FlgF [Oxalobacter sp.]|nr:MAG: flagellar basal-body rod protein FlgF [Oxalobacter sp.]
MDRLIYTAMTGAKHILEQQSTVANNLANVTTSGFRAQIDSFRAVPVISEGLPTRTFVVDATVGTNFESGVIHQTGNPMDVAVHGKGWIAVQLADGTEAYTRSGNLKLDENGQLQTQSGLSVMGDGGPITVPPDTELAIAKDGTVSGISRNTTPNIVTALGRLKLVNPAEAELVRGADGLFRSQDGNPFEVDENVVVVGGAIESSNVNMAEAMVNMITLARNFELHMNLLKNAESNADRANQILSLG